MPTPLHPVRFLLWVVAVFLMLPCLLWLVIFHPGADDDKKDQLPPQRLTDIAFTVGCSWSDVQVVDAGKPKWHDCSDPVGSKTKQVIPRVTLKNVFNITWDHLRSQSDPYTYAATYTSESQPHPEINSVQSGSEAKGAKPDDFVWLAPMAPERLGDNDELEFTFTIYESGQIVKTITETLYR